METYFTYQKSLNDNYHEISSYFSTYIIYFKKNCEPEVNPEVQFLQQICNLHKIRSTTVQLVLLQSVFLNLSLYFFMERKSTIIIFISVGSHFVTSHAINDMTLLRQQPCLSLLSSTNPLSFNPITSHIWTSINDITSHKSIQLAAIFNFFCLLPINYCLTPHTLRLDHFK